jgi:hypothetical protein
MHDEARPGPVLCAWGISHRHRGCRAQLCEREVRPRKRQATKHGPTRRHDPPIPQPRQTCAEFPPGAGVGFGTTRPSETPLRQRGRREPKLVFRWR